MKKAVLVTNPYRSKEPIQFAYDWLEKQGMNPFWFIIENKLQHKTKLVVARPVQKGDPDEIISDIR